MFTVGQTVRCVDDQNLTDNEFLDKGDYYTITWVSDNDTAISVEGSPVKFKASRFEEIDEELEAWEEGDHYYEVEETACCQLKVMNFNDNEKFNKYAYDDAIGDITNIGICSLRETQHAIRDALLERGWVEFGVPSQVQVPAPGAELRTYVLNKKPLVETGEENAA